DTRSCNRCAWNEPVVAEVIRRADALIDDWGADYIRLLLEAYPDSGGRVHWENAISDSDYLADMVEVVEHIGTKPGAYVLIALWQDPSFDDLGWPTEETVTLWRLLAQTFMEYDHVMFGLVNEPQANFDGSLDADCHAAMTAAVTAIREEEDLAGSPRHIITVQGTRGWARTLDYYVTNPITAYEGENIAYETHVYNPEEDFYSQFELPSETLPVVIGEFGPAEGYMTTDDCQALITAAATLQIPWLAWTFHQRCAPNLLETGDNECDGMPLIPTAWGQIIKDALLQK
ncbi:glycoside hydrolase family 5 protein, partial [Myxococcota bacterium]|nr:glycoside hydrolase family 5 protein [Myxococcota bacterium]